MKIPFLKKLALILKQCNSVDEFKCYCATHGVDVPGNERSFAKWFYDLAISHTAKKYGRFSDEKSAFFKDLHVPWLERWRKRFQQYLLDNIDDIIEEKKFKNLLSTYLFTLIEDEKEWNITHSGMYEYPEWSSFSPKKRLKYVWKQRNKLHFSDFNMLLVLAYFKKHGLQKSTT